MDVCSVRMSLAISWSCLPSKPEGDTPFAFQTVVLLPNCQYFQCPQLRMEMFSFACHRNHVESWKVAIIKTPVYINHFDVLFSDR